MSDEHDRDVQDWFDRSIEEPPRQPFMRTVLDQVRRRERRLQWRRYAAWLAAFVSVCLLLPELVALLNALAALPLALVDIAREQWPLLVSVAAGAAYWLVKQMRQTGFVHKT